jgi:hypothetical protein
LFDLPSIDDHFLILHCNDDTSDDRYSALLSELEASSCFCVSNVELSANACCASQRYVDGTLWDHCGHVNVDVVESVPGNFAVHDGRWYDLVRLKLRVQALLWLDTLVTLPPFNFTLSGNSHSAYGYELQRLLAFLDLSTLFMLRLDRLAIDDVFSAIHRF